MKICFFIMLLTIGPVWAQLSSEHSVTTEMMVSSAEEAKKQILILATMQAIRTHSQELGFTADDFFNKLNARFEPALKAKLDQEIQAGGEAQRNDLLQNFALNKENDLYRMARLGELIQSYTFQKLQRDAANPKIWSGSVLLQMDRVKLERTLRRIISGQTKQYNKLFLVTEVNLDGFTLQELGMENEQLFIPSLARSWEKYFSEHLPVNVEEVVSCDQECLPFYQSWQTIPQGESLRPDEVEYRNGLWLKINFTLKRSKELRQQGTLEWEGRLLLLDINTKRLLASSYLPIEKRNLSGLSPTALNSTLGSQLYRTPLPAFQVLSDKLANTPALNRVTKLTIKGQKNLSDVLLLLDLLKLNGASLGLDVKLTSFQQQEAQVLCFYQGEEKSFSDLLSRLKELKSSQSYMLVNEFTGVNHVLKLVTN